MVKKRRTKKQKENAKHVFTLEWKPSTKRGGVETPVKGQLNSGTKHKSSGMKGQNNAKHTALGSSMPNLKKEVKKSLFIFSLILGVEVMIYLFL